MVAPKTLLRLMKILAVAPACYQCLAMSKLRSAAKRERITTLALSTIRGSPKKE
jgi:hypothetical protein